MKYDKRIKKFVVLSDTHGTHRHLPTIKACCEFATQFQPDLLIHLGDNWDLAALRRGVAEDEESTPLKPDIAAGKDTLDRFFGSYNRAQKVYLWGNHEITRLNRHVRSPRSMVAEYAQMLKDDLEATVGRFTDESRPYCKRNGVFEYEGVKFLHGIAGGKYASNLHATSYGNSVFGHIHCCSMTQLESHDRRVSYSVPCGCELDLEYNATHRIALRQENGFTYGFVSEDLGVFDVHWVRNTPMGYLSPSVKINQTAKRKR